MANVEDKKETEEDSRVIEHDKTNVEADKLQDGAKDADKTEAAGEKQEEDDVEFHDDSLSMSMTEATALEGFEMKEDEAQLEKTTGEKTEEENGRKDLKKNGEQSEKEKQNDDAKNEDKNTSKTRDSTGAQTKQKPEHKGNKENDTDKNSSETTTPKATQKAGEKDSSSDVTEKVEDLNDESNTNAQVQDSSEAKPEEEAVGNDSKMPANPKEVARAILHEAASKDFDGQHRKAWEAFTNDLESGRAHDSYLASLLGVVETSAPDDQMELEKGK